MARLTLAELFANKSLFLSLLIRDGQCLRWSLGKTCDGYGKFSGKLAHRVAFEIYSGQIPVGMTVDHICFVRDCCAPGHLRLLPHNENAANQRRALSDFCGAGHERTEANTYTREIRGRLMRFCRSCNRERVREYKARNGHRAGAAA